MIVAFAALLTGSLFSTQVLGASLTSVTDTPGSSVVNATTTHTVAFTTATAIPNDGKIKVTFPSGFVVSGVGVGTVTGPNGTFTAGFSGQVVTVIRSGGVSFSPGSVTLPLTGIVNTGTAGSSFVVTVETTDGSDVNLDGPTDSSIFTIIGPPVLTGLNTTVTFAENLVNATAQLIDATGVTLTDADSADFNTGNLTVSYSAGGTTEDQLSIRNEGTTAGLIGYSGGTVTYGGVTIGTTATSGVGSGINGATLVVTFTTATATPAAVQALIGNLTYKNTSDTPTSSRTISVTINDGDGATSTAQTVAISVTAENDAPVLANAAVVVLNAVNEDAGAPSGAVGTLISSLVDFSGGGGLDNVSDVDASPLTGIAITATDASGGSWYYSTDNGANWITMGARTDASARLLAADSNTRVYFNPSANISGTFTSGLTFRAWDQTSGSNGAEVSTTSNGGSTAFSTATDTAAITVTSINDAPLGANTTITINEDTPYTFTAADFGFADPNDNPANTFLAVKITSLPTAGTLTANGIPVNTGDFVSLDTTPAGVTWIPRASGLFWSSVASSADGTKLVAVGGTMADSRNRVW